MPISEGFFGNMQIICRSFHSCSSAKNAWGYRDIRCASTGFDKVLSCEKTLPGRKRALSETRENALKTQVLKTQVNIKKKRAFAGGGFGHTNRPKCFYRIWINAIWVVYGPCSKILWNMSKHLGSLWTVVKRDSKVRDPGYIQVVHIIAFLLSPRSRVLMKKHAKREPKRKDGLPTANYNVLWSTHRPEMRPFLRAHFADNPVGFTGAWAEWQQYEAGSGRFAGLSFEMSEDSTLASWWRDQTPSAWLKHVMAFRLLLFAAFRKSNSASICLVAFCGIQKKQFRIELLLALCGIQKKQFRIDLLLAFCGIQKKAIPYRVVFLLFAAIKERDFVRLPNTWIP